MVDGRLIQNVRHMLYIHAYHASEPRVRVLTGVIYMMRFVLINNHTLLHVIGVMYSGLLRLKRRMDVWKQVFVRWLNAKVMRIVNLFIF